MRGFAAVQLAQRAIVTVGKRERHPWSARRCRQRWLAAGRASSGMASKSCRRERQLARSVHLGMARENLFDQRGTGPGQPDHEDRPLGAEAGPRKPRKEGPVEPRDQARDELFVLIRADKIDSVVASSSRAS